MKNSKLFSEFYRTCKKVLENLFNVFRNSFSQEIYLNVVQRLFNYLNSFALFLDYLHNLIEELIENPTSNELDYTIGQWNMNFDQCKNHAAACLDSLANIKVEQRELSANITMLRSKTKEIIAHLQKDLGSNITVKLPRKKRKTLKKIEFD